MSCEHSSACTLGPFHSADPYHCEIRRCGFTAAFDGRMIKCGNPAASHAQDRCVKHGGAA